MTAFEDLVMSAVAQGVPRERAEASVRAQLPDLAPPPADVAKDAAIAEKQEQAEIVKLFRAFGCKVYTLSQARAARVTPGLPDLWVTHEAKGIAFWFESKRQVGGVLSEAQRDFLAECHAASIPHCFGDRHDAAAKLVTLRLATYGNGPTGIVPMRERGSALPDLDLPDDEEGRRRDVRARSHALGVKANRRRERRP